MISMVLPPECTLAGTPATDGQRLCRMAGIGALVRSQKVHGIPV